MLNNKNNMNRIIGLLLLFLLLLALQANAQSHGFIGTEYKELLKELNNDRDTQELQKDQASDGTPFIIVKSRRQKWVVGFYFADRRYCSSFVIFAPASDSVAVHKMFNKHYNYMGYNRWYHFDSSTTWHVITNKKEKRIQVVVEGEDKD